MIFLGLKWFETEKNPPRAPRRGFLAYGVMQKETQLTWPVQEFLAHSFPPAQLPPVHTQPQAWAGAGAEMRATVYSAAARASRDSVAIFLRMTVDLLE
jgi:hypothetical protein